MKICGFVNASDWFKKNLDSSDAVFMKINVEGAECDILENLLNSNEIIKLKSILIMFDVKKIPSQKHREFEIQEKLNKRGINYLTSEEVASGVTHVARIQYWLNKAEADLGTDLDLFKRLKSFFIKFIYIILPSIARSIKYSIQSKRR